LGKKGGGLSKLVNCYKSPQKSVLITCLSQSLELNKKNKEIPSLGEGFNKSANMNVNIIMAYRNGIRKYDIQASHW